MYVCVLYGLLLEGVKVILENVLIKEISIIDFVYMIIDC